MKNVNHIDINAKSQPGQHSIDYKRTSLGDYRYKYMNQARKIGGGAGSHKFVYVRAKTGSDYPLFQTNAIPPNVTLAPCDEFQK
jgi:hypothetical protein